MKISKNSLRSLAENEEVCCVGVMLCLNKIQTEVKRKLKPTSGIIKSTIEYGHVVKRVGGKSYYKSEEKRPKFYPFEFDGGLSKKGIDIFNQEIELFTNFEESQKFFEEKQAELVKILETNISKLNKEKEKILK